MSISPSSYHTPASQENIAICEILAPPPELSDSRGTTSKVLRNNGWVHGDKAYGNPFEYFTHHVESELESSSGSLSVSVHETYLEPTQCLPRHKPKSDSHTDYESTPTPRKFDSLMRPTRSSFSLNDTDARVKKPCRVNAPANQSIRSLFPGWFPDPATLVISSGHSKFPYTRIGGNYKPVDGVSQSQFKIDESFRSDLSHSESLDSHMTDCLSGKPQDFLFIDPSLSVTLGEPDMPGTQLDHIDGCSDHSLSENIFNHTTEDCHSDLFADPMKTPEFDNLLYEDSSTHQGIKALPLLPAIIPSSSDPDEISQTTPTRISRIKVSEMTIPKYHAPPSITASNSPHPGKSRESDTLDYQYVSAPTFDRIDTKPTDILQITTLYDHNNPSVGLAKPSKVRNPPLEGLEFVQDGEELQPPPKVDSDPHILDRFQKQPQTRVSALGCARIYNSPAECLLFPFHKTDCPQRHDEIAGQLDQPYSVDVPTNRQWLTQCPLGPGLCMNDYVSLVNVEFQEHIIVYQDESGIQLAQSILACSLVSIYDHLAIAPTPQVIFVVITPFWILALILIIIVITGGELMWWLHWKADFT